MRFEPDPKYSGLPCSVVGTGCAYEYTTGNYFPLNSKTTRPYGIRPDGYLPLDAEDKYIRGFVQVDRKKYYKRGERPLLKDFLATNDKVCAVCVYGHFIFVAKNTYWSFFDNDNDEIVQIWYLNGKAA